MSMKWASGVALQAVALDANLRVSADTHVLPLKVRQAHSYRRNQSGALTHDLYARSSKTEYIR